MISSILDSSFKSTEGMEVILCMNEQPFREELLDILIQLKCKVYIAQSAEDASSKLQSYPFHSVILEEGYSQRIMQIMASFPMIIRRNIFYLIIGDNLDTNNFMQSFVLSCNMVFNKKDIEYFPNIFLNNLMENNFFFRNFYYALQNIAKEK